VEADRKAKLSQEELEEEEIFQEVQKQMAE
jgi:hypothetical protein